MSFFKSLLLLFIALYASSLHSTPTLVGFSLFSEQTSLFLISRAFILGILSGWDAFPPDNLSPLSFRSPSSHLSTSFQMTPIKYPFLRIFKLAWVSGLFGLPKRGVAENLWFQEVCLHHCQLYVS